MPASKKAGLKKVKKNYILYERQDRALQEWADRMPDLDKSGVLRIVVELGLAEMKDSRVTRNLLNGSITVIKEGDEDGD